MAHSCIKHSREIENHVEFLALSDSSYPTGIETGVFASAGIRVSATACNHYSIPDRLPDREFFDISARIRTSRPLEVHKAATRAFISAAQEFQADEMEDHQVSLTLEMHTIDPELIPKFSSIRIILTGDP